MPLSNKEKMARRRERLKADPGKRAAALEKDRLRKKAARQTFKESATEKDIKGFRFSEVQRVMKYYNKKKQLRAHQGDQAQIPEKGGSPFNTRQSLGKAVKRASRSLPNSPRKKRCVVKRLVDECGLKLQEPKNALNRHGLSLSEQTVETIVNFFNSDDISWQAPGKKDRIILRETDRSGKKVKTYVQIRYLTMSLGEAYTFFKEKHPDIIVGISKFCSLKPKHCLCFEKIPHNVCICTYHENVRLLLTSLKYHTDLPIDFKALVDTLVCNSSSKQCMTQTCNSCNNKIDLYTPENSLDEPLKYFQWKQVEGKAQKVEVVSTVEGVFDELKAQVKPFLIHTFVKRAQADTFNNIKSSVNGSEILIQMDFSENASLLHQNEIQSAHWSHSQATVFTTYTWVSDEIQESCVIVSNDLEHTKTQIFCFTSFLLSHLKKKYPDIAVVNVFSDGTSAQFKNRFMFSLLHLLEEKFHVKITWNFFATSHGKGVVDGIGGTIKRSVWNYVKANQNCVVSTAKQFATIAAERNPKITVAYVSKEDVDKVLVEVEYLWCSAVPVPETHSAHCVSVASQSYIIVGETTKDPSMRKVRILKELDHDSDENEIVEEEEIVTSTLTINDIQLFDWVVVKYENFSYPGEVTHVKPQENELTVKVMHVSKSGKYYFWPKDEDCISYMMKDVVKKIGCPIPCGGTREHYVFSDGIN